MSFSAPAEEEESLVLDFGAIHDLYATLPYRDAIARLAPGTVFRSIGMGMICQSWGGFLAGVPLDLQTAFDDVYQRGRYANDIDYSVPVPPPRLRPADKNWLATQITT